jgi:hypothetical protein
VFRPVARGGRVGAEALSPYAASLVIKQRIAALGLDPATYSGHSLRSGFLTSAAEAGASLFKLTEVSQHKSLDTLRGYVRSKSPPGSVIAASSFFAARLRLGATRLHRSS